MTIERDEQLKVRVTSGEKELLQRVAEGERAFPWVRGPSREGMSAWIRYWIYRRSIAQASARLHKLERDGGCEGFEDLPPEAFSTAFDTVYGGLLEDLDLDMLFQVLQEEGRVAAMIPSYGKPYGLIFLDRLAQWLIEQNIDDIRPIGMQRYVQEQLELAQAEARETAEKAGA